MMPMMRMMRMSELRDTDDNRLWALRLASREGGFRPHRTSVIKYLFTLEARGWIAREAGFEVHAVVTPAGALELARLEKAAAHMSA